MKVFRIGTVTNDNNQYREMRESFEKAGFTEARCEFVKFDNVAEKNAYEPYGVLGQLLAETKEKYLILCHHDVRTNGDHTYDDLVRILEKMDEVDPHWAIVGNAGRRFNYEFVMVFFGGQTNFKGSPERVHTLDENWLVIRTGAGVRCSPNLSGFHFYGTDICLHSILGGRSCYVVGFEVSHYGKGTFTPDFWRSRESFRAAWRKRFFFTYLYSPCVPIFLSRFAWIDRTFSKHFYEFRMMANGFFRWLASAELRTRCRLARLTLR